MEVHKIREFGTTGKVSEQTVYPWAGFEASRTEISFLCSETVPDETSLEGSIKTDTCQIRRKVWRERKIKSTAGLEEITIPFRLRVSEEVVGDSIHAANKSRYLFVQ